MRPGCSALEQSAGKESLSNEQGQRDLLLKSEAVPVPIFLQIYFS